MLASSAGGRTDETMGHMLLLLLGTLAASPAPPVPEELARMAARSAEAGDLAGAARLYAQASAALPHHAGLLVQLGRAQARLGRRAEAVESLSRAAAMGVGADLAALDAAFSRPEPAYAAVRRRFEDNLAPIVASGVAFRLPRDLLPESLAYHAGEDAFYVGSMHRRKIVRVDRSGATRDFVPPARDGLASVIGIKLDAARGELWAASCNTGHDPPKEPPDPATVRRGGLFRYRVPGGELVRKYEVPGGGAGADGWRCFNDLVLDGDGNVYLSSGDLGAFRLDRRRDVVEPFVSGPGLLVNGIAVSDDGAKVFLAAHARGVAVVDTTTRAWRALDLPADATLNGIDGLYVRGRTLIGVQNGLGHGPDRVVRAELDERLERAERVEILERAHPAYAVPTTGVLVGEDFYYVAASNLEAVDEEGRLAPGKLKETVVLRLPLGSPARAVDLEAEKAELLRLHTLDREAHFETDADKLLRLSPDEFIAVSAGRIERVTREAQRAMFTEYFRGATYQEWDDLEPPIVSVSGDASMAWMIVRTRVRRMQKDAAGKEVERRFVYAGIMTYAKRGGRWVRVANVSTFEPS